MRQFHHYHAPSGSFIRRTAGPDDYEPPAGDWIEAEVDPAAQYFDGTAPAARAEAAISVDKALIGVGETATVTCPDPCWLRVNGAFVEGEGGAVAIFGDEPKRITVQLAGQYRGPALEITVGDAIDTAFAADPRWQAIQSATPQQIDNWLTANVTNVAQARQVLRVLILAVRRLARGAT